jgi:hypothetical protein
VTVPGLPVVDREGICVWMAGVLELLEEPVENWELMNAGTPEVLSDSVPIDGVAVVVVPSAVGAVAPMLAPLEAYQ